MKLKHLSCIVTISLLFHSGSLWAQTGLSLDLTKKVSSSVYEVVLEKPKDDPIVYAEELPMDLIPFHIRNDEFVSIGTAFAVGENLFLSAAHVFALDSDTLRYNLSLRDPMGNTYKVDQILKYDSRRDYVLFTTENLKQDNWLRLSDNAGINEYVNAVGNAHGEGIIFRDGLLTSMTPERENGEWHWLRFSAAASPGNSGGPLLDTEGNVIGIVTAKSDNENLNYALPVSEIGDLKAGEALLHVNWLYQIPNINFKHRLIKDYSKALPAGYEELHTIMKSWRKEIVDESIGSLKEEYKSEIFPADAGSDELLTLTTATLFPCIINEKDDSTWVLSQPNEINTSELGAGGFLRTGKIWGDVFWQLELPEGEILSDYFDNPDVLMDKILSGYRVTRNVGSAEVRINSFASNSETSSHTDRWGRKWIRAQWELAFADYMAVLYALPTPSGAVGILNFISKSETYAYDSDFREMTDFFYVSYYADFRQWESFINSEELRPGIFDNTIFDYQLGEKVQLRTNSFDLVYDDGLLGIKHKSMMYVIPSFFKSAEDPGWDISRVFIYEEDESDNFIAMEKSFRPFDEHDAESMKTWDTLVEKKYPYNSDSIVSKGNTYIYETADLQGSRNNDPKSHFLWTYTVARDGEQKESAMQTALKKIRNGFTLNSAEKSAALYGTGISIDESSYTKLNDLTIFQAIALNDEDTLKKFIADSIDLETKNDEGKTPLAAALSLAQDSAVALLLETGVEINTRDKNEASPILTALRNMPSDVSETLLNMGADPDVRDKDGYSPLMVACQNEMGDIASVIMGMGVPLEPVNVLGRSALYYACTNHLDDLAVRMIRKGAPVSLADDVDYTLFLTAIKNSSEEVIKLLMEKGTRLEGKTSHDWTPLMMALRYSKPAVTMKLIETEDDLEAKTSDGWTVLHMAVRYGNLNSVKALIEKGSDIDARKPNKADILMLSLYNEENRDVADYLMEEFELDYDIVDSTNWSTLMIALRYGTEKQARQVYLHTSIKGGTTESGWTPLMFAVRNGHDSLIKPLLEDGNPMDAVNDDGLTALHLAAGYSDLDTTRLLVENGADINAVDNNNYTSMMQAARKGKQESAAYLLDMGSDTDIVSDTGWTALMLALRYCDPVLAEAMLYKGASVNISRTESEWSDLHLAVRYSSQKVGNLLMERGVEPNAQTDRNTTPLHLAAEYNEGLVSGLLMIGADPDLQNDSGETPIHVAVEEQKEEAVRQLLLGGARSDIKNNDGKTASELAQDKDSLKKLF